MAGIADIQQRYDSYQSNRNSQSSNNQYKELFLKQDGDQAFIKSIATGTPEDPCLAEIRMHTFREDGRWQSVLHTQDGPADEVPEGSIPSRKFALWAYVSEVIHPEKPKTGLAGDLDWEEKSMPSGKTMFVEPINDFKIITLSFGRGRYLWNELVDIYNDWQGLDKGVLRIKRNGLSTDTTYTITTVSDKTIDIPDDKIKETSELKPLDEYFADRYGKRYTPSANSINSTTPKDAVSTTEDDSDGVKMPF
tara:strand:+ start:657 stop:1406 length:750 start_codon:yes stop_codon:yes gene_type:complete